MAETKERVIEYLFLIILWHEACRREKDWSCADWLRGQLKSYGWEVACLPDGRTELDWIHGGEILENMMSTLTFPLEAPSWLLTPHGGKPCPNVS